ncbi:MAG: hypothetical protein J6C93_04070 [Clostridia bacterium]|nr:hypothetical protein [Clostridia bacterium]
MKKSLTVGEKVLCKCERGKDKSGAIGILSGKCGTHMEEGGVFFCALTIGKRRKRGGLHMEEDVANGATCRIAERVS